MPVMEDKVSRPVSFVSERKDYHPDGPTRPLTHELAIGRSLLSEEEDLPELIHPEIRIEALTGAAAERPIPPVPPPFRSERQQPSTERQQAPSERQPLSGVKPFSRRRPLSAFHRRGKTAA